jgi:hypothetical protein
MYEHRTQPLLEPARFVRRLLAHGGLAAAVLGGALALGAAGYHWTQGLPPLDSVLNAAMILSGMGPVDKLTEVPAKLFATFYALFSGVVFIAVAGLLLAPVVHRVLHRLHLDLPDE